MNAGVPSARFIMVKYIYNVEPDVETGEKYELIEIEVLEETQEHYIIRGYADLRKEEAFLTPEDAIGAYRTKLRETLERHAKRAKEAMAELTNFERTIRKEDLCKTLSS